MQHIRVRLVHDMQLKRGTQGPCLQRQLQTDTSSIAVTQSWCCRMQKNITWDTLGFGLEHVASVSLSSLHNDLEPLDDPAFNADFAIDLAGSSLPLFVRPRHTAPVTC